MECPYCIFSSHGWALGLPSPLRLLQGMLRDSFTPPACVNWPCNVGLLACRVLQNSQVFQTESPCAIPPPSHLSKKYFIPSRRSHPATFQDTVFLSSQSKGLGKIDGLQCNKYFPLQNSPGQREYRSTRIEMEVVNHFPSILILPFLPLNLHVSGSWHHQEHEPVIQVNWYFL